MGIILFNFEILFRPFTVIHRGENLPEFVPMSIFIISREVDVRMQPECGYHGKSWYIL